ncbi:LptA/OstA family protein [Thermodesulfobacteriota bacterium]
MNISGCNQHRCRSYYIWAAAFILSTLFLTICLYAGDEAGDSASRTDSSDEKIRITAERLISDSEARFAEFSGNVKATQGDTVIMADQLKVFYKSGPKGKAGGSPSEESIDKIVADGNVKIHFENRVAVARHAVYTTETRVLVLSGAGSKVTSGTDYISGEKIIYYRTDGKIVVEGGSNKQVEAVIHSGEKGIN